MKATPKDVLTAFDVAYQGRFHERAPLSPSKDAKLAKGLLTRYSQEQLTRWMATFFRMRDPFIQQSGYTFGVFVACLGKVIVASQGQGPKRPQSQPGEEHEL